MFPHDKLDWTLSRLDRRLEDAPDDPSARLEYATASLSKAMFHDGGEPWFNRALTQARRVLQADPGSVGARVVAGLSLVGLERLEPASRHLDDALRLDPDRADIHLALGEMHRHAGDLHPAVRALESACRLAPEAWEAHALLGRLLADRADALGRSKRLFERSQYHLIQALQLGPSAAWQGPLLHALAVSCLRTGRLEDAHKLFSRLLEIDRFRVQARWFMGLVAYHMGKYKNAVLHLRQHLRDRPESHPVHARIGMAYLHLGEVTKAREACNRALAIEPGDLQARWTLGCALLEEGRLDDAVRLFREILNDAPDHGPAFAEMVRIRRDARDVAWLVKALRSEVSVFDRLPVAGEREHPSGRGMVPISPRQVTRDRIAVLLRALSIGGAEAVSTILTAMDLTTDEGLRFQLWDAALDLLASTRAREVTARLEAPGQGYSAAAGRDVLTLASVLPEPLLTRGLQIGEDDLRRAAVDRYGPARDVTLHRANIENERQEARAWQALLLLAVATRETRSGRNLLVRWASDADPELADVARAALVVLGDTGAADALRRRADARGAGHLVDALLARISPPQASFHPRPVSDDEDLHCSTCGRGAGEADHMMAGGDAVLCNHCTTAIALDRRELAADDPGACCALCGRSGFDARAVYAFRGTSVCASCVDDSLGLVEREAVDRFLAGF